MAVTSLLARPGLRRESWQLWASIASSSRGLADRPSRTNPRPSDESDRGASRTPRPRTKEPGPYNRPERETSGSSRPSNRFPAPSRKQDPGDRLYPRLVADQSRYITQGGSLMTTPEVAAFFEKHGLEYDTSICEGLGVQNSKVVQVYKKFSVLVGFSPRPIIHPYHIQYFNRDGHALTKKVCADYEQMLREDSLWIWPIVAGSKFAVPRTTVQRRLKSSVYTELEKMGYARKGRGQNGLESIVGTLLLWTTQPLVAANLQIEEFGRTVAQALVARQKVLQTTAARKGVQNTARRDPGLTADYKRDAEGRDKVPQRQSSQDGFKKQFHDSYNW